MLYDIRRNGERMEKLNMLNIVLSGGPASGKSTSLSRIEAELSSRLGYKILICPETATELIANGIAPSAAIPGDEFQEVMFRKQMAKEELYRDVAAKYYDNEKTIILYDRGLLDQLAYMTKDAFTKLIERHGQTMASITSRYDAVIHLVTSAIGTDCYTTANNQARHETAEEAAALDKKTLDANVHHPHLRVIDNSTGFDAKIQRVLHVIYDIIGEPVPSEIERKFLIEYPDANAFASMAMLYAHKNDIIQTYLRSAEKGVERRVRQRGTKADGYSFYYTEKTPVSDIERIEKERKITMQEYVSLLAEADNTLHQVMKERICFVYDNQYFELDIYPFSDTQAIIEIELSDKASDVAFPPFLKCIKEVTNDDRYKNHSLAETLAFPAE